MPTADRWKALAAGGFKDYRLKVCRLVDNPVELSLDELQGLGWKSQITPHHCIQGWSGIAEWGGVPLQDLITFVRPRSNARIVVFHSFSDGVVLDVPSVGATITTLSRLRKLNTPKRCWPAR